MKTWKAKYKDLHIDYERSTLRLKAEINWLTDRLDEFNKTRININSMAHEKSKFFIRTKLLEIMASLEVNGE